MEVKERLENEMAGKCMADVPPGVRQARCLALSSLAAAVKKETATGSLRESRRLPSAAQPPDAKTSFSPGAPRTGREPEPQ